MPRVVFLCVANSARSQLAEGIARSTAPSGWEIFSAGSRPGRLNPLVPQVLSEAGFDPSGLMAKGFDSVPLAEADFVITLCAEEECPVAMTRGQRIHWPLPDPGVASPADALGAFRATRVELQQRIEGFWSDVHPQ